MMRVSTVIFILILGQLHFALGSEECVKKDLCERYQRVNIGPRYWFPFFETMFIQDEKYPDGLFDGAYITPPVVMNLSNKSFKDSYWKTYRVRQAKVLNSDFSKSSMRGTEAIGVTFDQVNFSEVDLWGSVFTRSAFKNSNLKKVNFSYSDLGFVTFENCDLSGTNFSKSNLIGTKFKNVKTDKNTVFPINFNLSKIQTK